MVFVGYVKLELEKIKPRFTNEDIQFSLSTLYHVHPRNIYLRSITKS